MAMESVAATSTSTGGSSRNCAQLTVVPNWLEELNERVPALIVAGAIIIATALWIYFSPYQSCVRALRADDRVLTTPPEITCTRLLGG